MSRTLTAAAHMAALLSEIEKHRQNMVQVRQQQVKSAEQRAAQQLKLRELELRIRRNELDVLDCRIALQQARLSRYTSAVSNNHRAADTARILQRGLTTMMRNRRRAEQRLAEATAALDKLRARYQSTDPGHAATTDSK